MEIEKKQRNQNRKESKRSKTKKSKEIEKKQKSDTMGEHRISVGEGRNHPNLPKPTPLLPPPQKNAFLVRGGGRKNPISIWFLFECSNGLG